MMTELARLLALCNPARPFNAVQRRIQSVTSSSCELAIDLVSFFSCMAHVIHLATRAFLDALARPPPGDVGRDEACVHRDLIAVIRAIVVKVHLFLCLVF